MTRKSYQRQHLALWAAGYINGAGTTRIAFGCQLTRIATGHYGLILDVNTTLADIPETFAKATPKRETPCFISVNDDSASLKTIRVFSNVPSSIDSDIEVALYRSVLPNL